MKTIPEIMRVIISGIMPRSDVGFIMALIAIDMVYEGGC